VGIGAIALALGLAACGDDSQEPADAGAGYEVSAEAMWPEDQKLAKSSRLLIEVTNQGEEVIPDIAVTVLGFDYELRDPNNRDLPDPDVADPERPQFVVDKSPIEFETEELGSDASLVDREVAVPYGRQTSYVGTYTLGELDPDETAIFRWDVTAVKAGPYKLDWSVAGGTEPGDTVVDTAGDPVEGSFSGVVSDAPVDAEVAKDGKSVVREGKTERY
jgi:hypothetical protein